MRTVKLCFCRVFVFFSLLLCFAPPPVKIQAGDWKDSISLDEVQNTFERLQDGDVKFSIESYVSDLLSGNRDFSMREFIKYVTEQLTEQIRGQASVLIRILALGILAGIFLNFSGTIGDQSLGETGLYITYLALFTTITTGFYTIYQTAKDAMDNLLIFMRALIPSFSLALGIGGGLGTSLAYYETMLIAMSFVETFMLTVLLPGTQIYFVMGMLNPLSDNRFSKLVGLFHSFLSWCARLLFGILIGYQGIQGLLVPVLDRLKNNTVWQTAKSLPGVGNTAGSLADTVAGSGLLLKSAVGVGGVIGISIICLYPLIEILVLMLLYRIGGALLQPVSDKRMVSALQAGADSAKLLLEYVMAGALLFVFSILIILVCVQNLI